MDKEQRQLQTRLGELQKESLFSAAERKRLEGVQLQIDAEHAVLNTKRREIEQKWTEASRLNAESGKPLLVILTLQFVKENMLNPFTLKRVD